MEEGPFNRSNFSSSYPNTYAAAGWTDYNTVERDGTEWRIIGHKEVVQGFPAPPYPATKECIVFDALDPPKIVCCSPDPDGFRTCLGGMVILPPAKHKELLHAYRNKVLQPRFHQQI